MSPLDLEALTRLILAKYPDMRFADYDYWTDSSVSPSRRLRPPNLRVQYKESLNFPMNWFVRMWREPPGWEPFWPGPNENGIYWIANFPRFEASIQCGGLPIVGTQLMWRDGRIMGSYAPDDIEHRRFIASLFRLIPKVASQMVNIIDQKTGEVIERSVHTSLWVGHDLIRWLREDPRRSVEGVYQAPD